MPQPLQVSSRWWTYSRDKWDPEHRWRLQFGGDEYGRRTVVTPIPFRGYVVWAYRTCRCSFCNDVRKQTAQEQANERAEGPWCRSEEPSWCLTRTRNPSGLCDEHEEGATMQPLTGRS